MNVDVTFLKVFHEVKQYVKMLFDYGQATILVKDMLIFDVCIYIQKKKFHIILTVVPGFQNVYFAYFNDAIFFNVRDMSSAV